MHRESSGRRRGKFPALGAGDSTEDPDRRQDTRFADHMIYRPQEMVPHPSGLAGAVADFQALGAEDSWRRAVARRQAAQAQQQQQAEVGLHALVISSLLGLTMVECPSRQH